MGFLRRRKFMMPITSLTKVILVAAVVAITAEIIGFSTTGWIRFQARFQGKEGETFTKDGRLYFPPRTLRYELGLCSVRVCTDNTCVLIEKSEAVRRNSRDNGMSDRKCSRFFSGKSSFSADLPTEIHYVQ